MSNGWLGSAFNGMIVPTNPDHTTGDSRWSFASAFKPISSRIAKSSSAGNTPSSMTRRRTTIASRSSRCRTSYADNSVAARTSIDMEQPRKKARPTSWHPSSSQNAWSTTASVVMEESNDRYTAMHMQPDPLQTSFNTTNINGLITPLAQPCVSGPVPQGFFTLDDISTLRSAGSVFNTPYSEMWPTPDIEQTYHNWQCNSTDQYLHESYFPTHEQAQLDLSMDSGFVRHHNSPPTPDFLPIQGFPEPPTSNLSTVIEQPRKPELVGMGLYDVPARRASTQPNLELYMAAASIDDNGARKGLKLEDAFDPSSIPNDEDDEDDEDAEVDEIQGQELKEQAASQPLSGRSFFFESDEPAFVQQAPTVMTNENAWRAQAAPQGWL